MKRTPSILPPLSIKSHHFDKIKHLHTDRVFYRISTQKLNLSIIRNIKHIS